MADKKIVISGVDNFSSTLDNISKSQSKFTSESISQAQQRLAAIKAEEKAEESSFNKKKELNNKIREISLKEEADIENILSKDKTFNQKREKAAKEFGANTSKYENAISSEKLKAIERNQKAISLVEEKSEKERKNLKDKFRIDERNNEKKSLEEGIRNYEKEQKEKENKEKQDLKRKHDLSEKRESRLERIGSAGETGINASMMAMSGAMSSGNAFGATAAGVGGVASSMASLIPAIGGIIGTAISGVTQIAVAALQQARQQEVAAIKSRNLTGQGLSGGVGFMTTTEMLEYNRATALQRGMRGDKGELAKQATFERQLGYDPNQLFGNINRFASLTSKDDSIKKLTEKFLTVAAGSKLWGVDKGDFSMLGDVMKNVASLMDREVSLFEEAKGDRSIMNMATFGRLGGAWANPNIAMGRMQSIDAGIRNPNNPFVDMLVKSSILKNKPNASLMDLMDLQEQGIMNPETLGTMLKSVKSSYSGEQQHLALMNMFPSLKGSYAARESLLKNYDIFQGGMSSEQALAELKKRGAGEDVLSNIKKSGVVGTQQSVEVQMLNELAKIGKTLANDMLPLVQKMIPLLSSIGSFLADPSKMAKNALKSITSAFSGGFDDILGEAKQSYNELFNQSAYKETKESPYKAAAKKQLEKFQKIGKFKNLTPEQSTNFINEWTESTMAQEQAVKSMSKDTSMPFENNPFYAQFSKSLEGMTKEMAQAFKENLEKQSQAAGMIPTEQNKKTKDAIDFLLIKVGNAIEKGKFVTNEIGMNKSKVNEANSRK